MLLPKNIAAYKKMLSQQKPVTNTFLLTQPLLITNSYATLTILENNASLSIETTRIAVSFSPQDTCNNVFFPFLSIANPAGYITCFFTFKCCAEYISLKKI